MKLTFKKVGFAVILVLFLILPFLISKYGLDLNRNHISRVILKNEEFLVEVADTPAEHAQGLSGRRNLSEHEGMLFIFDKPDTYGFWMKGMNVSIDIIWIQGDKVIGVAKNLEPNSYPEVYNPPALIDKVLEVVTGTVQRLNISAGDVVSINLES